MPAGDPQQPHNDLAYMMQGVNRANHEIDYTDISREFGPWITPTLLNSYTDPAPPRLTVQYRMNYRLDKHDWRGHVNLENAESATVAFLIDEPFILDYTYDFTTHWISGPAFNTGVVVVHAVTGEVVVYWITGPA
jgi:hypothetical protein